MTMTNQEAFDKSTRGIISQGCQPAVNAAGMCLYRAKDGKRCAYGWLIPDDEYNSAFEGKSADNLPDFGVNKRLASELQEAHDNTLLHNGVKDWKAHLERIALRYGLSPAILDEIPLPEPTPKPEPAK